MQKIEAPSKCPSCNSELEVDKYILYCRNPECGSQKGKKLEHFAKTMKIKGLGPRSIQKLELQSIADIYRLSREEYIHWLGDKIYKEVDKSRGAPLNLILPSLSIPLIGNSATGKLSQVCTSIEDINEDTCKEAGLGPKATGNLLTWLDNNKNLIEQLPFSFKFITTKPKVATKGVVCISGRLKSYKTKAEAAKVLEDAGYQVKSTVTKDVTHLINESGVESSKTKKARDSGIIVISNIGELI